MAAGHHLNAVDGALAETWLSVIRERLAHEARLLGVGSREFATTISIAIVSREVALVIVVGDSPCIVYDGSVWMAPIWPMKGEYPNQTHFVTQDPIPRWGIKKVDGRIDRLAVLTDGIYDLVLREQKQEVFQPFFDVLFGRSFGSYIAGRNREVSGNISSFLDSDRVNNLTDDYKTLVIACRLTGS